ncbi:MAG: hypothetical protein JNM66_06170, partial [Bryobacterales bacterium]|nr:hypothetical protein [Bryobacterales bacterium]
MTATMARPGKGTGNAATVTQTRTWVYDATTQRLTSVTHPESSKTTAPTAPSARYDYN